MLFDSILKRNTIVLGMMSSEIIQDWLEEGFLNVRGLERSKVRRKSTTLPILNDETGRDITPKPLFHKFVKDVELEPNLLIEYFETIHNCLRNGKALTKVPSKQALRDKELLSQRTKKCSIEYERKNIFLSKEIFTLFELPDYIVPQNSPQYNYVSSRNQLYMKYLETRKNNPQQFFEQDTQAGYFKKCDKLVETTPIILNTQSTHVNNYLMTKHYERKEGIVKKDPKTFENHLELRIKFSDYKEFLLNVDNDESLRERLHHSLHVLERCLDYNSFQSSILSYSGAHKIPLTETGNRDILEHNLTFHLPVMESNYCLSCVDFNPSNASLFVCGYGINLKEEGYLPRGFVLCWNIHKSGHPERIYETKEAVTCLHVSHCRPHLVAAGMQNGLIGVFDLRKPKGSIDNRDSTHRPVDGVRSVKWLEKKYTLGEEQEILLAVGLDEKVTTWSYTGHSMTGRTLRDVGKSDVPVERSVTIRVKPSTVSAKTNVSGRMSRERKLVASRSSGGSVHRSAKRSKTTSEAETRKTAKSGIDRRLVLFPDSSGLCLEVKPGKEGLYLMGTLEGHAFLDNANDTGDYIRTFNCHNGPIRDIKWSPLVEDVFFSCGSDQTLHMWDVSGDVPTRTLSFEMEVLRIAASDVKSTLFAALTEREVHVFDVDESLHKPLVVLKGNEGTRFSSVAFCPRNHWMVIGKSDGTCDLYKLVGVEDLTMPQESALRSTFILKPSKVIEKRDLS